MCTCSVKEATKQHQVDTYLSPRLGCVFASRQTISPFWIQSNACNLWVLDVSATRQIHSNYSMLAIAVVVGHYLSLAEAGEGHHLPGLGDLEGTILSQGLTACKRNKQKQTNK